MCVHVELWSMTGGWEEKPKWVGGGRRIEEGAIGAGKADRTVGRLLVENVVLFT